jgi:major membrane immunogen (membrane-anchored lipoprotein)
MECRRNYQKEKGGLKSESASKSKAPKPLKSMK